jgi:15-cis-phytoene synthase
VSDPRLNAAFAACERVVREQARNFYYGLRLTPEPKRSAMYAIYAWMRAADDLADGEEGVAVPDPAERRRRLERFREETDLALAGRAVDDRPIWLTLAAIAPRYRLVAKDFHDMLDGQLADIPDGEGTRLECARWEDLRLTCYRVASTVGLVCIRIWGYSDERAVDHAVDRGIAFQLTNILRDIREDAGRGRVYLPRTELERAGLTIESLLAWRDDARCRSFLDAQIERAFHLYRVSEPLESMVSPECEPTLWALTRIYHRLLERIASDPRAALLGPRVRLPTWEKLWIAFRARRRPRRGAAVRAETVSP